MDTLSNWECADYILVPDTTARNALFEQFGPDADIERKIGKVMCNYVNGDPSRIDEVVETREDWKELHPFHYDMRIKIGGVLRYIETRLVEKKLGMSILVVRFKVA